MDGVFGLMGPMSPQMVESTAEWGLLRPVAPVGTCSPRTRCALSVALDLLGLGGPGRGKLPHIRAPQYLAVIFHEHCLVRRRGIHCTDSSQKYPRMNCQVANANLRLIQQQHHYCLFNPCYRFQW